MIGVLALQGAFKEHIEVLKKLNVNCIEVRKKSQLNEIDGLILPGGESTAIGRLLIELDIKDYLIDLIERGMPVWGTCAGMIILAKDIGNEKPHINLMDIKVKRNGYGRQLGSFVRNEKLSWIGEEPFPMVFIRAPYIESCSSEVEILQVLDDKIVAVKQNNILATSFHPEITNDTRCHEYFLEMIKDNVK